MLSISFKSCFDGARRLQKGHPDPKGIHEGGEAQPTQVSAFDLPWTTSRASMEQQRRQDECVSGADKIISCSSGFYGVGLGTSRSLKICCQL